MDYTGPERRQFTRREIDRKNDELMKELRAEVLRLSTPTPPCSFPNSKPTTIPTEVWIARIDGRVIAVTHWKQDMVLFLKEQCQYFDIRSEQKNQITGNLRWRQTTETFDVTINRYPIRYPSQSSVHTEQKG